MADVAKEIEKAGQLLARRLEELRAQRQLSRPKVAQQLGVTASQYRKYEIGQDRITATRLYRLARFYQLPLDSFFTVRGELS